MNQILVIENKKNRNGSGKLEIHSVIKIFTIAIIIFGAILIGKGSYAIYKESKGRNTDNIPTLSVERVNDTAIIKANSINKMTYLKYSWNTGEETAIPVEGTSVQEEIILPIENSTLNITIEEETGRAIKYSKEFILEGIDISKPTITIDEENQSNIKITATDETQMQYIKYQLNDSQEVKIDKTESEDKTMVYILKIGRGENKLKITAVDSSGNTEVTEKTIIVSAKPTMQLKQNKADLTVIIQDTDGIKDLEINFNGQMYAGKDINRKELKVPFKLKEGKNTLQVKVTNVNGLVAEDVREINYAR